MYIRIRTGGERGGRALADHYLEVGGRRGVWGGRVSSGVQAEEHRGVIWRA